MSSTPVEIPINFQILATINQPYLHDSVGVSPVSAAVSVQGGARPRLPAGDAHQHLGGQAVLDGGGVEGRGVLRKPRKVRVRHRVGGPRAGVVKAVLAGCRAARPGKVTLPPVRP